MIRFCTRAMTLACLAGLASCSGNPAFAQASPKVAEVGDTAVIVPWGDIIVAVAQTATQVLIPVLVTGIMYGLAKLFPWATKLISASLVERLVTNITDYGLNAVAGAAKGKTLPIQVGSAVIAEAVQRGIDQAPAALLKAAEGAPGLAEKVFRKLDLEPLASVSNTLVPALEKLPISADEAIDALRRIDPPREAGPAGA